MTEVSSPIILYRIMSQSLELITFVRFVHLRKNSNSNGACHRRELRVFTTIQVFGAFGLVAGPPIAPILFAIQTLA